MRHIGVLSAEVDDQLYAFPRSSTASRGLDPRVAQSGLTDRPAGLFGYLAVIVLRSSIGEAMSGRRPKPCPVPLI